jgi:putative nucleotidyltransferase with HDIG domain
MLNTTSPQATILIVDDEAGPRDALKMILRPFYNLAVVDNGHAAMRMIKERSIDLVTLDLKLPDRQGAELLQEIKLERPDIEVIIVTGYGSLKSAIEGMRHGAAGYLLKPFNVKELITLINQTLERKRRLDAMRQLIRGSEGAWLGEEDPTRVWRQLRDQYPASVGGNPEFEEYAAYAPILSDLLEAKDRQLMTHSSRVSFYCGLMAAELGLSASERKALVIGGFVHDIGKIGLPSRLVARREALTDREEAELRRHVEVGARLMAPLGLPAEVGQIISYHHERYDGSGYPEGLQAEGIPALARVVAVVQTFDHLTTGPAGQTLSVREAGERLRREAGACFDPKLTELFVRVAEERKVTPPEAVPSPTAFFPKS